MSQLTYNGVQLPYVQTTQFSQEASRDDSVTDLVYTKFDIVCNAVVNTAYISAIYPPIANATSKHAADAMNVIRSALLKSRKTLSFKVGGVELIPSQVVGAGPGTVDARNGPQPQSCNVFLLTDTTFLITYHITAHYYENFSLVNPAGPAYLNVQVNNVLSNRWSETADYDSVQGMTRTREGKFIIASNNAGGFIADQVRIQMAMVSVPLGFLRQRSRYTVDPTGLGLAYNVVDKEEYKMPPSPAYEVMEPSVYRETTTKNGGVRVGQASIVLRGSKTTDQNGLIASAVAVCLAKIAQRNSIPNYKPTVILQDASLTQNMYRNTVSFEVSAMIATAKARYKGDPAKGIPPGPSTAAMAIAGFDSIVSTTPFSTNVDNYQPSYAVYGTAGGGLLLQAAAYYDPAFVANRIDPTTNQLTNGLQVGQAGQNAEP